MADRYYGIDRGRDKSTITDDSSTTSKDVEIRVDLAPGMSRHEVIEKIKQLTDYIMEDQWPPA